MPAAGEHVDVTLTDVERCDATRLRPARAPTLVRTRTRAGQCTITFTSPTAGKVTGHASSTLSIGGVAVHGRRPTVSAPNSADAVKTFVDANIQIDAGDGDEPGRHEPHAALPHQRQRRFGRLRERAGGDGLHGDHHRRAGHARRRRTARTVGATGTCHVTITSATTGHDDDPGDDDGDGRRRLADPRRPVTRTSVTARTRRRTG